MCSSQKQPTNTQLMSYPAVLHVTHLMCNKLIKNVIKSHKHLSLTNFDNDMVF